MRKNPLPPLVTLQELFVADFERGLLYWNKDVNVRRHKVKGAPAGCLRSREDGRVVVGIKGKRYFRYHILWIMRYGSDPWPLVIDHIDRDPTNDAISNLRAVTVLHNAQNWDFHISKSKSRVLPPGIHLHRRGNYVIYEARIEINGKRKYLGSYKTPEKAAARYRAVRQARLELFGNPTEGAPPL